MRLTRERDVERLDVDGVPVDVFRPGRGGPWPAWVFVTGAHPLRRTEPVVQRLARALARTGFVCLVPDVPGLGEGKLTTMTLEGAVAVTHAAAEMDDVREGRVSLCGASTGASLALLVAAEPDLAGRIGVVTAITPYADLQKIIALATTSSYEGDGRTYEVTALLRRSVARSLCASLASDADRALLLAQLVDESDSIDPLECFRALESRAAEPETQRVVDLLANSDPARCRELVARLSPEVRDLVASLSPIIAAARVSAPVELIVPPTDLYFPHGEAESLVRVLPNARLTVTATLDHTRPSLSLGRLPDLFRFQGFVLRGLRAAL
jgi:pimeloyl-ACP methyl ester carboxylesterase